LSEMSRKLAMGSAHRLRTYTPGGMLTGAPTGRNDNEEHP
jgi:hypothetical protein